MSSHQDEPEREIEDDQEELAQEDVEEEVVDTGDVDMTDDHDENLGQETLEEIQLQNDSSAHFDAHKDSIYCIAQHPKNNDIVATGGGDDVAYVWNCTPNDAPVLPASYRSDSGPQERAGLTPLTQLGNHSDSVNAICFIQPDGDFIVTGGLDGRVNVFVTPTTTSDAKLYASAQEVEEVNWLAPCPHAENTNTFALGASDGSVWIYRVNSDSANALEIVQSYHLHTAACTAGSWTPDGKLLVTVSEDSGLYVWDVFGEAVAAGIGEGQAIVSLGQADERFFVEGGLYSTAISPGGAIVAVGGAEGHIRVVGLPRLSMPAAASKTAKKPGQKGAPAAAGQSGVILASLQAQSDGVESLSFSQPPLTLLAAGSVDGSIALFDVAHNFAVRRHIKEAHDEEAVIKVEFVQSAQGDQNYVLTSCGNDGVVKRWDTRGGTSAAGQGLMSEWKGHRGGGEGGGIFDFVQGDSRRIVTAGDE